MSTAATATTNHQQYSPWAVTKAVSHFISSNRSNHDNITTKTPSPAPPIINRPPAPSSSVMFSHQFKKEAEEYSDRLKIFIGTWNMYGRLLPIDLSTFLTPTTTKSNNDEATICGLDGSATHPYHLLVIGTQECERDISESLFYPSKEVWEKRLSDYLGSHYKLIKTETLAALHIAVFVWLPVQHLVKDVQSESIKTGWANMVGNKGAVAISVLFGSRSLLFINCHLRAHQTKLSERNANVSRILSELKMPKFKVATPDSKKKKKKKTRKKKHHHQRKSSSSSNIDPPSVIDQFDHVFLFGDTNYRINAERPFVFDAIKQGNYNSLLEYDQLSVERKTEGSALCVFQEHPIHFPPTYKLDTVLFAQGGQNNSSHLVAASSTNTIPVIHDSSESESSISAAMADNIQPTTTTDISLATSSSSTSSLQRINSKQPPPLMSDNSSSNIVGVTIRNGSKSVKNSIKRRLSGKRKVNTLEKKHQVYMNGGGAQYEGAAGSASENIPLQQQQELLPVDSKIALFDSPTTILSYDSSEKQRVPSWTDRILWCDRASRHPPPPPSPSSHRHHFAASIKSSRSSFTSHTRRSRAEGSGRLNLFPFMKSHSPVQRQQFRDTICYAYDAVLHESLFGVSDHMPVIGVFGLWFDEWASYLPPSSTQHREGGDGSSSIKKKRKRRLIKKLPVFILQQQQREEYENNKIPHHNLATTTIPQTSSPAIVVNNQQYQQQKKSQHHHWWQRLFG